MVVGVRQMQVKVPMDEIASTDRVSLGRQAHAACEREKTHSEGFAEQRGAV